MKAGSETTRDPGVLGLLLQRHAELLRRNTTYSAVNRVLLFVIALVPITGFPQYNNYYAGLLCMDAVLIAAVWHYDRQRAGYELRGLEDTLSRYAGGDIEDIFIRTRGIPVQRNGYIMFAANEPIYWATIAVTSNIFSLFSHYGLSLG